MVKKKKQELINNIAEIYNYCNFEKAYEKTIELLIEYIDDKDIIHIVHNLKHSVIMKPIV